ncbi:MAG: hypothetical protein J6Y19_12255 [Kiritimatiellae bacterium]|nr:hypothetical protein [Kiritimatiellia bacterium]MBP5788571.1 hypothetical protein [Kiritimatiellia bacterium]
MNAQVMQQGGQHHAESPFGRLRFLCEKIHGTGFTLSDLMVVDSILDKLAELELACSDDDCELIFEKASDALRHSPGNASESTVAESAVELFAAHGGREKFSRVGCLDILLHQV